MPEEPAKPEVNETTPVTNTTTDVIVSNETVVEEPAIEEPVVEEYPRNYFCSSEACTLRLGADFCATDECINSLERLSNTTIELMFFQDLNEVDITDVQEEIIKDIEESFNSTADVVNSGQVDAEIQQTVDTVFNKTLEAYVNSTQG